MHAVMTLATSRQKIESMIEATAAAQSFRKDVVRISQMRNENTTQLTPRLAAEFVEQRFIYDNHLHSSIFAAASSSTFTASS